MREGAALTRVAWCAASRCSRRSPRAAPRPRAGARAGAAPPRPSGDEGMAALHGRAGSPSRRPPAGRPRATHGTLLLMSPSNDARIDAQVVRNDFPDDAQCLADAEQALARGGASLRACARHPTTFAGRKAVAQEADQERLARLGLGDLRPRRAVPDLLHRPLAASRRDARRARPAARHRRVRWRGDAVTDPVREWPPSWSARTATAATTAWCSSPSSCRSPPASGRARPPLELARRMGLARSDVAAMEAAAEGYTFFVVYGRTAVAVDCAALDVPEVESSGASWGSTS